MSGFSDYLEAALLEHIFKISAGYAQPGNLYVALSTAEPLDDNSGLAEPAGNGYLRTVMNSWTRTGNEVANSADVVFPEASGSWGTITHFAIMDASSGGNQLGYGSISPTQAVGSGNTLVFKAGQLTVSID